MTTFTLGQPVSVDGVTGVVRAIRAELRDDASTREIITVAMLENDEPVLRDIDLSTTKVSESQDAPPDLTPALPVVRTLEPIDFQRRFSISAYCKAKQLAESGTDPTMTWIWGLFDKATSVRLDNPDTIAGVNYMRYVAGILTAEEAAAILA